MDEKFFSLLQKAKDLKVVDSGSILIFDSFIKECTNRIRKNDESIQRLKGMNEQLQINVAMMNQVVSKYINLQIISDQREEKRKALKEGELDENQEEVKPASPEESGDLVEEKEPKLKSKQKKKQDLKDETRTKPSNNIPKNLRRPNRKQDTREVSGRP